MRATRGVRGVRTPAAMVSGSSSGWQQAGINYSRTHTRQSWIHVSYVGAMGLVDSIGSGR